MGEDEILFLTIIGVVAWFYFIPIFVAIGRNADNKMMIFIINLFLGGTLIGWVVALALAFKTKQKNEY